MKVYELSFQKNIRDIGGMVTKDGRHIKYGRLIRGSVLTKIDENDEQIIKGLNITDIIDFRSPDEFEYYPDFHLDGVRMHNLPVLSKKTNDEAPAQSLITIWTLKPQLVMLSSMIAMPLV